MSAIVFSPHMLAGERARVASDAAGRASGTPALLLTRRSITVAGNGDVPSLPSITFDAPFLEEPTFTFGSALVAPPNRNEYRLPVASLFLLQWELNEKSQFVGARLGASIVVLPLPNVTPTAQATATIVFHASFLGMGLKTIDGELTGATERQASIG